MGKHKYHLGAFVGPHCSHPLLLLAIMSSNRPPQLQLSLSLAEGNGTSFKRSFEQYGFDLETPVNGEASGSGSGLSGSSERDERNKRARSESSTVESVGSSASSSDHSSVPESSSALGTMNVQEDGLSAARPISVDEELFATSIPSSLPMAHQSNQILSQVDSQISPSAPTSTSDHLRASLERFSAFDGEISALRRPPTAPPTLPPISALADTDDRHSFGLDLDMMEENSGVPGLQVFSLGEFHTDGEYQHLAQELTILMNTFSCYKLPYRSQLTNCRTTTPGLPATANSNVE